MKSCINNLNRSGEKYLDLEMVSHTCRSPVHDDLVLILNLIGVFTFITKVSRTYCLTIGFPFLMQRCKIICFRYPLLQILFQDFWLLNFSNIALQISYRYFWSEPNYSQFISGIPVSILVKLALPNSSYFFKYFLIIPEKASEFFHQCGVTND